MRISSRKCLLALAALALAALLCWRQARVWAQDAGTVFMGGAIVLIGGSSGEATLEVPAAAGTPTQTLPSNSGIVTVCTTIGTGVSGGGTLSTGGNSCYGTITSAAATGNVLTPGVTCTHATVCVLSDRTTSGGAKVTAVGTTTCTFSATASDTVDYSAGCI